MVGINLTKLFYGYYTINLKFYYLNMRMMIGTRNTIKTEARENLEHFWEKYWAQEIIGKYQWLMFELWVYIDINTLIDFYRSLERKRILEILKKTKTESCWNMKSVLEDRGHILTEELPEGFWWEDSV